MVLPVISAILSDYGWGSSYGGTKISYENGQWNDSDIGENASMDFVSCGDYVINSAIMSLPMAQNLKYMVLTVKSYSLKILME